MAKNPINDNPATEQLIHPELGIRELFVAGKEQPTYRDHLQVLEKVPDYVLEINGILSTHLDEGDLGVILATHRDVFKAIKFWLEYADYVDNTYVPDFPELHKSWEIDYRPLAEESLAFLHLCEEILKRDPMGWKDSMPELTATKIWFSCMLERSEGTLRRAGVLGDGEHRGKQGICDQMLKQTRSDFQTVPKKQFLTPSEFERAGIPTVVCTELAVLNHAEYIAQLEQYHDFHLQIYKKYLDIKKRAIRSIRNNPNIQLAILDADGSLFVGGKGRRGKDKKKRKAKKGLS